MGKVGRTALTFIGYYFFGPVGALIGSFLGQILFPLPGVKGPRLNELNLQTSTVGAPIPLVYGTYALAGNIIWSSGLIETKHEDEVGGFLGFGGQEVTNYTYSVDVAIGICEGEITNIRRIWADADLIYDASDDATLAERLDLTEILTTIAEVIAGIRAVSSRLNFELYTGTEDQLPDPTIQSYENVGYAVNVVPGYRGLAYIVIQDFQLEKFGNRIPNFRFEVTANGTDVECGIYSAGHLEPWQYMLVNSVFDPRNPDNQHLYHRSGPAASFPATQSYDVAMADFNAFWAGPDGDSFILGKTPQGPDSDYVRGWARTSTPNYSQPCDFDHPSAPSFADSRTVSINLNQIRGLPQACVDIWVGCVRDTLGYVGTAGDLSGFRYFNLNGTGVPAEYPNVGWDNRGDCSENGTGITLQMWARFDQEMMCRRWQAPLNTSLVTWTRVAGTFKSLRSYDDDGSMYGTVLTYPKDPTVRSDSIFYNDEAFWTAAYNAAVAENSNLSLIDPNRIPEDWVYGVDYPHVGFSHATNLDANFPVWRADCTAVEVACVPMSYIVSDICRRAGLRTDTSSQIDVSDLTTCVQGYAVGTQMSARDALGPLRMFGLWDCCESAGLLKFVERGHAVVDTLTSDDLGVHEHGSQPPSAMQVSRLQEKDLPRRVRLHFPNFKHDHEISEQSASRLSTEAVSELDVELAIAMDPDNAAQLAEIFLYDAWVGRNSYEFALDHNWLKLEPTDCIEIPVDGQLERVRILSVEYSIGGILKISAQRDDDGSYTSTAVATPSQPSGGAPGGPGSGLICLSYAVLLDIPRLREADIDAGYYLAIYGECPDAWECAELYRSSDGGLTYGRVARTNSQTPVGQILDITGPATDPTLPGDSPPYDAANSITVTLYTGELASVTDAQIDAGLNMAAIGQDGAWVIIQFKTATLDTGDTWVLTDIIWGLNDTQHLLGTTGNGDTFVLLSSASLQRVPESADAIGVEKDFKALTCGQGMDEVEPFQFTTWGLSYRRTCPSTVISASLTEPPEDAADGDAYLLPNDTSLSGVWALHGGQIAKWSDETDSWVYCTPTPGTVIHVIDVSDTSSTDGGGGDVIVDEDGNTTPAPWARSDESYVTVEDETLRLPNSEQLKTAILDVLSPGDNINFETDTGTGVTTIHGESGLEFQDEGIAVGAVNTVNFVGAGVTSSVDSSGVLDVTIPGGGTGDVLVSGAGIYAIADESRSLTTTLTDDPALQVTLEANSSYQIRVLVYVDTNATADFKSDLHFTGTTTSSFLTWQHTAVTTTSIAGAVGATIQWIVASPGIDYVMVVNNSGNQTNIQHVDLTIETGASGGVLSYRWAQNTSNAGATVRRRDSCMIVNGGDTDTGGGFDSSTTAADLPFTPDSSCALTSTNVQDAINELCAMGVGSSGSAMSFVDEYEVTGSAATDLPLTGLDLDADDCYYLQIDVVSTTSGASYNMLLYLNGDTTSTNYERTLTTDGASASAADNPIFGGFADGDLGRYDLWITRNPSGRIVASASGLRTNGAVLLTQSGGVIYDTSANLTSLTIHSDIASKFAIGTRARIWKLTRTTTGGDTSGGGSPLTTKGDLYTYDTDDQRLPVGTDGDTVIADSAEATGLKWGVPGIPSNAQTGNYTITADDNGRGIDHASGAGAGDTYTIPANGTLALPLGFTFSVFNMATDDVTVAITTDTLYKAEEGTTGDVTIPQYCAASFRKVASTAWLWWGVGAS